MWRPAFCGPDSRFLSRPAVNAPARRLPHPAACIASGTAGRAENGRGSSGRGPFQLGFGDPDPPFARRRAAALDQTKQDSDEQTDVRRRPADLAAVAVPDPGLVRGEPKHREHRHRARHRRRLVRPARSAQAHRAAGRRRPPLRLSAPATTSIPGRAPTSRSAFTSCAPSPTPTICCAWSSRRARTRWSASAGASGRAPGKLKRNGASARCRHAARASPRSSISSTSPTASRAGKPGCARCWRTCSSSTRRRCIASARAAASCCALQQLDGATIKRVIDDWGRTPLPYTDADGTIGLSAGLSAGAQGHAGGQLFGARHHLPAAQRARPQGLRLFAGAAGADDGQHRAAPPALAARLFHRRLDPRRADRRADVVDAGADQAVPGLLGHRVRRRPRQAPPRQIRARRQRAHACIRPRSRSTRTTSTNGSPASSALPFRCRRNGR